MFNKLLIAIITLLSFCVLSANEYKPPQPVINYPALFKKFNQQLVKAGHKPLVSMTNVEEQLEERGIDREALVIFMAYHMSKASHRKYEHETFTAAREAYGYEYIFQNEFTRLGENKAQYAALTDKPVVIKTTTEPITAEPNYITYRTKFADEIPKRALKENKKLMDKYYFLFYRGVLFKFPREESVFSKQYTTFNDFEGDGVGAPCEDEPNIELDTLDTTVEDSATTGAGIDGNKITAQEVTIAYDMDGNRIVRGMDGKIYKYLKTSDGKFIKVDLTQQRRARIVKYWLNTFGNVVRKLFVGKNEHVDSNKAVAYSQGENEKITVTTNASKKKVVAEKQKTNESNAAIYVLIVLMIILSFCGGYCFAKIRKKGG